MVLNGLYIGADFIIDLHLGNILIRIGTANMPVEQLLASEKANGRLTNPGDNGLPDQDGIYCSDPIELGTEEILDIAKIHVKVGDLGLGACFAYKT